MSSDPCRTVARNLFGLVAFIIAFGVFTTPVYSKPIQAPLPVAPAMAVNPPIVTSQEGAVGSVYVPPEPTPVPTIAAPARAVAAPQISGSHEDWMRAAGIPEDVWSCANTLINRESGWRVDAKNPSSGALGIPQSLPGSKMASAGADYLTNPITQLRWMLSYVDGRYGGFCQALQHSYTYNWY
jgi:hypothetical protein